MAASGRIDSFTQGHPNGGNAAQTRIYGNLVRITGSGDRACPMIEIVTAGRCIACDICVKACPANFFDPMPGAPPVIARQEDCQTCFLGDIYCPADALYVALGAEGADRGLRGGNRGGRAVRSYARTLGWRRGKPCGADKEPTFRLRAASR